MKKREWFLIVFPIILAIWSDRVTKNWATLLGSEVLSYGPFNFLLHHNHGAMLGLFSDLPGVLRIVTLSTGGAFLLCSYALIQYLLPGRMLVLRTGLSILIGGILGNVIDRILWGHVVDFIVFGTQSFSSPAFNLADAIQWGGYGMIVYSIIKHGEKLWPENNSRKTQWLNYQFQFKYSMLLTAVGLGLTLISIVFSYTYLRVTISELVGQNEYLIKKFLTPFIITYSLIGVSFCFVLFTIGRVISLRIVGPLYAFERFLKNSIFDGKRVHLKLRAGDEFQHLQELSDQISVSVESWKVQNHNLHEKIISWPTHHMIFEQPESIQKNIKFELLQNEDDTIIEPEEYNLLSLRKTGSDPT